MRKIDVVFFFKQKTAYEMRISDWSSDVCSSDLGELSVKELAHMLAGLYPEKKLRVECRAQPPADSGGGYLASTFSRLIPDVRRLTEIDRKSGVEGKSVAVRVDLGGRRIIKKKTSYT